MTRIAAVDKWAKAGGLLIALAGAGPAEAETYTLFNPVPTSEMHALSADRPDITESPFAVDAGHFQVEMDVFTRGRDEQSMAINESHGVGAFNLKAGLIDRVDVQFVLEAWKQEKVEIRGVAGDTTISGVGDFALRLKINIAGQSGESPIGVGALPYVVFPTAQEGLGTDEAVYGLAVPFGFETPGFLSFGAMVDGSRIGDTTNWLFSGVAWATVSPSFGVFAELARSREVAVGGGPWSTVLNTGFAYGLNPDFAIDGGAAFGLTDSAPDYHAFVGLTLRR